MWCVLLLCFALGIGCGVVWCGVVWCGVVWCGVWCVCDAVLVDLQSILGEFIHTVLDAMKEHVELKVVLGKILTDHAQAEFREFRATILGILDTYVHAHSPVRCMLSLPLSSSMLHSPDSPRVCCVLCVHARRRRYGYEQNILTTANTLIVKDMYRRVKTLHKGLSRAFAPKASRCMSCSGQLADPPMNARTRTRLNRLRCIAFGCGHAFHESCVGVGAEHCPLCKQERRRGRRRCVDACFFFLVVLRSSRCGCRGRCVRALGGWVGGSLGCAGLDS